MTSINLNLLRDTIQDCNINFLIGSGLSNPYLETLGNIEKLLTDLDNRTLDIPKKSLIKASLYNHFFNGVISRNIGILENQHNANIVLENYKFLLKNLNILLLNRKSNIISKQINIFTTNIDIFLEKALESIGVEFNDGFSGRFNLAFSLSNFRKSYFKKSLHYDNLMEIPVFNLLKLHGSLSWIMKEDNKIYFSNDLSLVRNIITKQPSTNKLINIGENDDIDSLSTKSKTKIYDETLNIFLNEYNKLLIVNPNKDKFRHTLLNQTYYELLRIYANELEKENTILFILGFSFADEHIREITIRVANSNPTLIIYIIAYDHASMVDIQKKIDCGNIRNNNIIFIEPPQELSIKRTDKKDKFKYTLENINSHIFSKFFVNDEAEQEND